MNITVNTNKSVMISINPKWVDKIFFGNKRREIRLRAPKNFVGWFYVYCTNSNKEYIKMCENFVYYGKEKIDDKGSYLNGKVVGKFYCNKIEKIKLSAYDDGEDVVYDYETATLNRDELLEFSNLTNEELHNYLDKNEGGYAINITNIEVFDEPRELKRYGIKQAPQSWCYIKGEY